MQAPRFDRTHEQRGDDAKQGKQESGCFNAWIADVRFADLFRCPAWLTLVKYGILFLALGVLIAGSALQYGSWYLLLLWPAFNGVILAIAYLARVPQIFGKRSDGTMNPVSTIVLLPYLSCLWLIWHVLRLVQSENAFDNLNDRLVIGRRLLYSEMPPEVQNVIDLTCEFNELGSIVSKYNYVSFPILDASVPGLRDLRSLIQQVGSLKGKSFIHCAQGHGRTGLVSAAILLSHDPELTVDEVLEQIRAARPALRCNREQTVALNRLRDLLSTSDGAEP